MLKDIGLAGDDYSVVGVCVEERRERSVCLRALVQAVDENQEPALADQEIQDALRKLDLPVAAENGFDGVGKSLAPGQVGRRVDQHRKLEQLYTTVEYKHFAGVRIYLYKL